MEYILFFVCIINIFISTVILFIIQKPDTSGQTISSEVEELKEIISVSNQKSSSEIKKIFKEIDDIKNQSERDLLNLKKYISNEIDKLRD